jgi:hypothetical protein
MRISPLKGAIQPTFVRVGSESNKRSNLISIRILLLNLVLILEALLYIPLEGAFELDCVRLGRDSPLKALSKTPSITLPGSSCAAGRGSAGGSAGDRRSVRR